MQRFQEVLDAYYQATGREFPEELLPPVALQPLAPECGEGLVWASAKTGDWPLPFDFAEAALAGECPAPSYCVGFWGYGINSYAFYYQFVKTGRTILLRLPYGGVYSDMAKEAEELGGFLDAFAAFLRDSGPQIADLLAVESMGSALYRLHLTTGETLIHRESLLRTPDFTILFSKFTSPGHRRQG